MSFLLQLLNKPTVLKRPLFYWLVAVFNRVSESRIKEVGADIACAEWLIRNGAAVKWGNLNNYLNNYDTLAAIIENQKTNENSKLFIHGVDATDSAISYEGFQHFDGCKYINHVKLVNCVYIGNEAISKLNYLRNSLKNLEISNCTNVTESGLNHLKQLTNLEKLKLANLPAVKNETNIIRELRKSLPKCEIILE
ncbi:hypothetical protein PV325_010965 [Microctonus aethiopoides]|uniref:Mitochondrial ATP synthase regulatory component factor B n=1 Tax=Microctonus aethiopoides TaxID=144406 RepID=A0AA39C958_9HYME|nr:hypothetical protein PV325_010965 [Microctonus aethiopoides]KAK0098893.1 hypothetical protein PV326_000054 [Microctonus aethiopoides]KAK0159904.1 hypothetical protein PV328_007365 [Microctonus aethiopoides]